jgi:hypothetical protein
MQRTLIAVFDNHADAQSAIEELAASGFSRPQMRLSEGDPTGGASPITGEQVPDTSRSSGSFADGIKNFLGTIFGTDNSEHAQQYSDAVTHGHHVLTLTVGDESDAERATAIVERFGPVDIDERAAQWSGEALAGAQAGDPMRNSAAQQQNTASMSQQGVHDVTEAIQRGQEALSQQRAQEALTRDQGAAPQQRGSGVKVFTHEAAATLNETEAAIEADEADTGAGGGGRSSHSPAAAGQLGGAQPAEHQAATTLNETEAAIDSDDEYYLGHFNSNYAGSGDQYSHHAPAYKYGADMAANEQYRGRPWTDVNSELRRDWEGRNPGAAWDRFEASVRYGWERRGS